MTAPLRFLTALATSFAALATLTAAAPAGTPLEIYAILSTSGNAAFIGSAEARALNVIEDSVNAKGGVNGRPLHFTVLDDQTNAQVDVQLATDLVAKHVPIIVGPSTPAACFAIGPITEKTGPVSFCLNPFAHPAPGSSQFAPFADSSQVAAATIRYFRENGMTRIAMINATDGTGRDADLAFAGALRLPENRSVTLVAQEHYAAGDVSVSAQLAHIEAQNPQAIISYNTGLPFGTVLRGLHDAGIDLPVATTGGNMTFGQMQQYAEFLPSLLVFGAQLSFAPGDIAPGPIRQRQEEFIADLKRAGLRPEGGYEIVWDPAQLAVDVMRHLPPGADAAAARAYLDKLHGWVGTDGVYDFISFPQRGLGENVVLMMRWDRDAKAFVPVSRRGGAKR